MKSPGVAARPFVVVSNPVAGNGRGQRYAHALVDALEGAGAEISWEITQGNPAHRVEGIIDALGRSEPGRAPVVVVCGGDGTAAEVCEAIHAVQTDTFRPTFVPGPGGTAGDMRRELGVPTSPAGMLRFLATAVPVKLDVVTASNDGGPERIILHSSGNGVSGAFFSKVEGARRKTGRTSIPAYLKGLASGVAAAEVFYVSIDGSDPLPAGEVFTGVNATSMGAVTRIPLPADGARVHAIPLDPRFIGPFTAAPGIPPLLDAFRRGALFMMGSEGVIAPGRAIGYLPENRMKDVLVGASVRLKFFDAKGNSKQVLSIANGDFTGPASDVVIRNTGEKIDALAAAGSAYRIRRGLAAPKKATAGLSSLVGGLLMYEDVAAGAVEDWHFDAAGAMPSAMAPFVTTTATLAAAFFLPATPVAAAVPIR